MILFEFGSIWTWFYMGFDHQCPHNELDVDNLIDIPKHLTFFVRVICTIDEA